MVFIPGQSGGIKSLSQNLQFLRGDDSGVSETQPVLGGASNQKPAPVLPGIGTTVNSGAASGEATGAQGPVEAAPTSTLAPPSTPAPRQAAALGYQRTGNVTDRLFAPIDRGVSTQQGEIGRELDAFRTAAGALQPLQGTRNTIRDYLNTGTGEDAARSLLGAEYTGPAGLDPEGVASLQDRQRQLQERQQATQSGQGVQTLIGQSVAGLTPGQLRFEAERLLTDPRFRAQSREALGDVQALRSTFGTAVGEAERAAQERTERAGDIRELASGYLEQKRGEVNAGIDQRLQAAQAEEAAVREAFARLREGDFSRLQPGQGASFSGLKGALYSPDVVRTRQAQAQFDAILGDPRYQAIAGIDPLALTVTGKGREFYATPEQFIPPDKRGGDPVSLNVARDRGWIDPATYNLLLERDGQLRSLFGGAATGQFAGRFLEGGSRVGNLERLQDGDERPFTKGKGGTPGQFSDVARLTPEGRLDVYQPGNLAGYLRLQPGMSPTRENVAAPKQREILNRISGLLDEVGRLEEAEPFRAARIVADVEGFLADEKRALEERKGRLTREQKQWTDTVNGLRKRVRKASSKSNLGAVGTLVGGGIGTALGGPFGRVAGAAAGGAIGGALQ